MRQISRFVLIGLMAGILMGVGGCASSGGESKSAEPAAAAAPTMQIPANSKLAKITIGMTEPEVRKVLGEPSNVHGYPTGKNWIPFYFGGDTYREDWTYPHVGRVIFGNTSRWSRTMKVVDLVANPDEM